MTRKLVHVSLTREELWELSNNFDASFEPGPGNELAERISKKLNDALSSFRKEPTS